MHISDLPPRNTTKMKNTEKTFAAKKKKTLAVIVVTNVVHFKGKMHSPGGDASRSAN